MNAGSASSSASSRSEPARHGSTERREPSSERDAADFERALRDKGGWEEEDTGSDSDCGQHSREDPSSAATPQPMPPTQPQCTFSFNLTSTSAQVQAEAAASAGPPRLPVEAMRAAEQAADLDASLPAQGNGAHGFEVSVNERLGLPLSVQVMPPGAVQPGAGWTLSITSHQLNPELLKRYSGRLEERLRSRSITNEPVRIEQEDDEA